MKDEKIIELLERRDESALRAAEEKYGAFCHTVTSNILSMREIYLGGMVECTFIAEGKLCYVPEGSGKLYVADELGRNPELAVEFDSTVFNPGHLVGDYIIGRLKTEPRDRAALNIKTGEITPIPGLTYP
jgi:hypothetical protein